jgi:hypothetical protein
MPFSSAHGVSQWSLDCILGLTLGYLLVAFQANKIGSLFSTKQFQIVVISTIRSI